MKNLQELMQQARAYPNTATVDLLNAEVERTLAEMRAALRAVEKPEKISAKTLYQRLVLKLYTHWATLFPMVEWVDPESAADRIVAALHASIKARDAAKLIQHHSPACKEERRGVCCCGLAQLKEVLK